MPFYFDMFGGHAGDATARQVIGKQRKELTGGSIGVNPILFLSPDGVIVSEIDAGKATTAGLLAKLEQVLGEHQDYARSTDAEDQLDDPIERAELLIDLRRDEQADRLLADVSAPRAHLLRARLARWRGDFDAMKLQLAELADIAEFAADVRMESAYELFHGNRYEELAKLLQDFPPASHRYSEARYFEGLAHYHAGRKPQARQLWQATIHAVEQDEWVYRMDWAWADSAPDFGSRSPLGRIGYMGAYRNQDLRPRR